MRNIHSVTHHRSSQIPEVFNYDYRLGHCFNPKSELSLILILFENYMQPQYST